MDIKKLKEAAEKDGGPAFPIYQDSPGMTLRDYFAAKALPGCLGHSPAVDAARAYEYADAMLAAREAA